MKHHINKTTGLLLPILITLISMSVYARPDYGMNEARQLAAQGDTLGALQRLEALPTTRRDPELTARLYRSFGLYNKATESYDQLVSRSDTPDDYNRAWVEMARAHYYRGEYEAGLNLLHRLVPPMDEATYNDASELYALTFLAAGQYAKAIKAIEDWKSANFRDAYSRYNLGVALVKRGDHEHGSGMLEAIGTMKAKGEEQLAMRDRTNLALGWHFLKQEQGVTAKPVLQRIRLDGPFSNSALLAAGWAELAPAGEPHEHISLLPIGCIDDPLLVFEGSNLTGVLRRPARDACDPEAVFVSRESFTRAKRQHNEAGRFKRALVPWSQLRDRKADDAAVLEALLAIPYALSRLGALQQAAEEYRHAINTYESQRQQLNGLRASIEAGTANDLKQNTPAYLRSALASHTYEQILRDEADLAAMSKNLGDWSGSLAKLQVAPPPAQPPKQNSRPAPPQTRTQHNARNTYYEDNLEHIFLNQDLDSMWSQGNALPALRGPDKAVPLTIHRLPALDSVTPDPSRSAAAPPPPEEKTQPFFSYTRKQATQGTQKTSNPLNPRLTTGIARVEQMRRKLDAATNQVQQTRKRFLLDAVEDHNQKLVRYLSQARLLLAQLRDAPPAPASTRIDYRNPKEFKWFDPRKYIGENEGGDIPVEESADDTQTEKPGNKQE